MTGGGRSVPRWRLEPTLEWELRLPPRLGWFHVLLSDDAINSATLSSNRDVELVENTNPARRVGDLYYVLHNSAALSCLLARNYLLRLIFVHFDLVIFFQCFISFSSSSSSPSLTLPSSLIFS
ncbi:hypothetical protein N657DRAFT_83262 [Parathielavia appendiculata]|uniref:Uncharacterized protein n=1 Tax=Parathielavia appendiculata TaxID=2587402 RepID=A0AAN6UAN9_9PEZI|nr:hypothetical protein N657DRAFT_83262 [Parathielavia appendiculata]